MTDDEKLDRIEEYVDRIMEVLADNFTNEWSDTAAFTAALAKVLGIWLADLAADDNRPVSYLVKRANGAVMESARKAQADRRREMQ